MSHIVTDVAADGTHILARDFYRRYLSPADELTLLMGGAGSMMPEARERAASTAILPEVTDLDRRRIAEADFKRRLRADRLARAAASGAIR